MFEMPGNAGEDKTSAMLIIKIILVNISVAIDALGNYYHISSAIEVERRISTRRG